ncbi:uncharacterized protein BKA78DRAFT_53402 [Phyllosticta capitalensis]|uniref:uncharacterized protein n=1 Tax=Phyllosticta capitalensis TaxID=121624 RepID=UPI00312D79B8
MVAIQELVVYQRFHCQGPCPGCRSIGTPGTPYQSTHHIVTTTTKEHGSHGSPRPLGRSYGDEEKHTARSRVRSVSGVKSGQGNLPEAGDPSNYECGCDRSAEDGGQEVREVGCEVLADPARAIMTTVVGFDTTLRCLRYCSPSAQPPGAVDMSV